MRTRREPSVRRWVRRRRGLALIELVAAIAIIAVLAAVMYGVWGRGKSGEGKPLPEQAVDRAKGVECQNMLRQVRMGIDMDKMETGTPPPSIPPSLAQYAKCPQTGKPYRYDPQTGSVTCTTPGHESF
jgi:prepilin-type N-terminal cleavage/methylation domain-containing protein